MSDDAEQTEATTMSERIRDTMAERQHANHARLFGPRGDTATDTDDDGDDAA